VVVVGMLISRRFMQLFCHTTAKTPKMASSGRLRKLALTNQEKEILELELFLGLIRAMFILRIKMRHERSSSICIAAIILGKDRRKYFKIIL
jgi:hypothetical protein